MDASPTADLFPTISHIGKRAFLTAYMQCGQLRHSCRQTGLDHTNHYYWLKTDPAYAEAFTQAREYAVDHLEDIAMARATAVEKPSDILLIFLLKAARPEKYRDHQRKDESRDISELLKAVLLEMHERSLARDVTPDAEWAPVPPGERPATGTRPPLPAPPGVDEERR